MKLKSLLFGSAAALVAVTGAQAADMPMAEPVEYVRVCDAFGTGFFYIPGTDTCLKISGYVRVEMYWQADVDDTADPSLGLTHVVLENTDTLGHVVDAGAFVNNSDDNFTTFARGALSMDARRMTDIGLLRTAFQYLINVNAEFDASENNAEGQALDFAFIQLSNDLGTMTVGHTGSFFNFKGSGTLEGVGANDANTTLLGYSFNVGNGASFSIAVEDSNSGGRNGGIFFASSLPDPEGGAGNSTTCEATDLDIANDFMGGNDAEYCYADHDGDQIPDIVANIRLDQAWGSIQLMGALHHVRGAAAAFEVSSTDVPGPISTAFLVSDTDIWIGHDEDWGWAVGAGGELSAGAFSAFLQGFYGEGAGNYFFTPVSGGPVPEAVWTSTGSMNLIDVWFINGAIEASLGSTLTAILAASYGDVSSSGTDFTGYDEWAIAGDLRWSPVSGFTIGVGVVHWDNSALGDGTKGRVRFQSSF